MDLSSLVASFQTGTYTVTRRARGATVRGRVGDGTTTTLTIAASVSPAYGSDLSRLKQGRQSTEGKVIFTTTPIMLGGQGEAYEADRISIGGVNFEVEKVETWNDPVSGGSMYRVVVRDLGE